MTAPQDSIFTEHFHSLDPDTIARTVQAEGAFALENALTPEFLQAIQQDVDRNPFNINVNGVHGVHFGNQYYVTHMLAVSRAFFAYCTHPKVLEICDRLLGADYRLSAQRYYETYGGHNMRWHTDNKTDRVFQSTPGIIFIAYLTDVDDGEFQYVRGSQQWSGEKAYNEYDDDFIEREHAQDIVSFRMPKGTLLIYDTFGIHRAKPVAQANFVRKSLFFQVDRKLEDGEPILLKTEFAGQMNARLQSYLGFGKPSEYRPFPDTQLSHLPLDAQTLRLVPQWVCKRLLRRTFEALPLTLQQKLKEMLGPR